MRLSSTWTKFHKHGVPLLMLFTAVIFVVDGISTISSGRVGDLAGVIGPALLAVVGFVFFRRVAAGAADLVLDEGDALVVRKGTMEERLRLEELREVRYDTLYPQVTLVFRDPTELGAEVTFIPLHRMVPWAKHPAILGLMKRVAEASAG